ncbi:ABC transporter substrate-binding protein [uncultured Cetobacterium sp.]|uniref:ABC transporter substrate-binding protein n=1 Tax=uncultured Cetobacterium sp. TaxID=527638 RepID=UPI002624BCA9|nr:ABC transporter substrate-binding protein [uncultured Cetobacterium sp.]
MLKNIKKLIVLSVVALSIVSCGKKESNEVSIYMWGGSKDINKFMDEVVTPKILKDDNIVLKRVPIVDIKDVVNKLIIEKQAGKKDGAIDVLWVNGENFKALKDAGVLEKDILTKVPNRNLLKESTTVKDFGEPINNLEVPFGEAQFNFIYNEKNGGKPFTSYETLETYVKNNPGKFTYPTVTNFTGSAFVRNIAIDILGFDNIQNMSNDELKENLEKVWTYFNNIKPYLWREGKTYPESDGKIDLLYSTGELNVAMGYTINKVNFKINSGEFPKESKSFLLDKGTLFNNHYLAIPANSQHKENAIKVINELISPEIQMLKQSPKNWGDFTVLDLNKLNSKQKEEFSKMLETGKMVDLKELTSKRVFELAPSKLKIIDEGWIERVGKN